MDRLGGNDLYSTDIPFPGGRGLTKVLAALEEEVMIQSPRGRLSDVGRPVYHPHREARTLIRTVERMTPLRTD